MLPTLRRLRFDWQILPLLLAAVWGFVAAYDTRLAIIQFGLALLGIVLYFAIANLPDPILVGNQPRSVLACLLVIMPLTLGLYFLLTNDWSKSIGKLHLLNPILTMLAANPLSSIGAGLNPNAVGGAIAILLPLQVFALRRTRRWLAAAIVAVSLLALFLSEARGAWFALAVAALAWVLWSIVLARVTDRHKAHMIWSMLAVVGVMVGAIIIAITPLGGWLLNSSGDRVNIWRNSLSLIRDYPVTGIGLGSYEMVYASYALLTHVGCVFHAHNILLDIWLDLGALGLIAFIGMIVNAVWPKPSSPWRLAALVSLLVMLVHGLADDALWGYAGILLPITFIPLALLARPAETTLNTAHRKFQPAWAIWLAGAIGLLAMLVTPAGRALLIANWGALQQTRAELAVYHWPDVPLQDVLRYTGEGATAIAVDLYRQALNIDPGNATALWRLGQIELAQGQYQDACQHLAAAQIVASEQRATRQLLGECYALHDQADQAVGLWRTIDTSESQLDLRRWWYETYLGDATNTARLNRAIAMLSTQ